MSVKDIDVIDGMGIDTATNTLVLMIIDPYPWGVQEDDHLKTFQTKINHYVAFIESGQYRKAYGSRLFDGFRIELTMKYPCRPAINDFFEAGQQQLRERNIDFVYSVHTPKEEKA